MPCLGGHSSRPADYWLKSVVPNSGSAPFDFQRMQQTIVVRQARVACFARLSAQDEFGSAGELLESFTLNNVPKEYAASRFRADKKPEITGEFAHIHGVLTEEVRAGLVHRSVVGKAALSETSKSRAMLLFEAHVMAQFDHEHILALVGVVTVGGPVLVLLEGTPRDLHTYLVAEQPTLSMQLALSLDVARGVSYLTSIGYTHRALRAANVRLTAELVAKVAGFDHSVDFLDDATCVRCLATAVHSPLAASTRSMRSAVCCGGWPWRALRRAS